MTQILMPKATAVWFPAAKIGPMQSLGLSEIILNFRTPIFPN